MYDYLPTNAHRLRVGERRGGRKAMLRTDPWRRTARKRKSGIRATVRPGRELPRAPRPEEAPAAVPPTRPDGRSVRPLVGNDGFPTSGGYLGPVRLRRRKMPLCLKRTCFLDGMTGSEKANIYKGRGRAKSGTLIWGISCQAGSHRSAKRARSEVGPGARMRGLLASPYIRSDRLIRTIVLRARAPRRAGPIFLAAWRSQGLAAVARPPRTDRRPLRPGFRP
jgi:hypothetical protein